MVERPHIGLVLPDAIHAVDGRRASDARDFRQDASGQGDHAQVLTLALLLV